MCFCVMCFLGQDDCKEEGSDIEVPLDLSSKSTCSTPSIGKLVIYGAASYADYDAKGY